jgi:hypothetical protein
MICFTVGETFTGDDLPPLTGQLSSIGIDFNFTPFKVIFSKGKEFFSTAYLMLSEAVFTGTPNPLARSCHRGLNDSAGKASSSCTHRLAGDEATSTATSSFGQTA